MQAACAFVEESVLHGERSEALPHGDEPWPLCRVNSHEAAVDRMKQRAVLLAAKLHLVQRQEGRAQRVLQPNGRAVAACQILERFRYHVVDIARARRGRETQHGALECAQILKFLHRDGYPRVNRRCRRQTDERADGRHRRFAGDSGDFIWGQRHVDEPSTLPAQRLPIDN